LGFVVNVGSAWVVIASGWVGRRVVSNCGPALDLIVTSLLSAWRSGMARSRVELSGQIRRDGRAGGSSIRELADRHHVHRRTVRQALASALPPPRKAYPPRPRPAIGPYAAVIDGWLVADRDVPPRQRHTARRIWQRLVAEHGAGVAEVTVSRYVARRRAELGLDKVQVMVPQAHLPGAEAEVDFGEFHAQVAGVLLKLQMFVMRLSCSGRAFHVAFATQAQEAFLEGHVLALEYLGAVPSRIRYDNLKPAVVRVLRGRDRVSSCRWLGGDQVRGVVSAHPAARFLWCRVLPAGRAYRNTVVGRGVDYLRITYGPVYERPVICGGHDRCRLAGTYLDYRF
jgi:transposase